MTLVEALIGVFYVVKRRVLNKMLYKMHVTCKSSGLFVALSKQALIIMLRLETFWFLILVAFAIQKVSFCQSGNDTQLGYIIKLISYFCVTF